MAAERVRRAWTEVRDIVLQAWAVWLPLYVVTGVVLALIGLMAVVDLVWRTLP